jgi:nitrite reductase/ring-hydroxylating ferredoxin subunit
MVVARLAEFPPGERRIVTAGGRSIGVFRVGDAFYAVRNRCPHQGGPLCDGRLQRRLVSDEPGVVRHADAAPLIACPWHGWEYDLATGQSFTGPARDRVRAYDVSVERGASVAAMMEEVAGERIPGPYVAETFPVRVEEDYVVLDA